MSFCTQQLIKIGNVTFGKISFFQITIASIIYFSCPQTKTYRVLFVSVFFYLKQNVFHIANRTIEMTYLTFEEIFSKTVANSSEENVIIFMY